MTEIVVRMELGKLIPVCALTRCEDCVYATNNYKLVDAYVCANRDCPCFSEIVDKDFFCMKGKKKEEK